MSTTDKLAQALRYIVDMLRANPTNVQSREHVHLGIAANRALAEYDATPAMEVTADAAVEVTSFIAMHGKFMEILNDMDDETFDRQLRQFRELRYGLVADALDDAEATCYVAEESLKRLRDGTYNFVSAYREKNVLFGIPLYTHPSISPVADGWKLVPLNGTSWDMRNEARELLIDYRFPANKLDHLVDAVYRAMVNAAPSPPNDVGGRKDR